ncbi:circularly permutated Ras protein 1 isoform X1 [Ischnura elegans]|uniref:circularly permutated Ras protein 1 isoform X1 n=1 Tax=Ischnura elegans TaxID=197161 RepID=UPI001ED86D99|nr:circularly permutated Ras protein 1 isoform X1 [Ischnura elegans]
MVDQERIRLVVLGGAGVGKSSILQRFLFRTFPERHKRTVEDLYTRDFKLARHLPPIQPNQSATPGGPGSKAAGSCLIRQGFSGFTAAPGDPLLLKVDLLDTAGDLQFPAMRRLCIATAHAFLIVYSVTDAESLDRAKGCLEEVREQRADVLDIPIVLAGNKVDVVRAGDSGGGGGGGGGGNNPQKRAVTADEVAEWLTCEMPNLRARVIECSAKEDHNVNEIFQTFLALSQILGADSHDNDGSRIVGQASSSAQSPSASGKANGGGGLKRRSSAYVSASRGWSSSSASSSPGPDGRRGAESPSLLSSSSATSDAQSDSPLSRSKPRSRSLIRRCSRKAKQQMREAHGGANDCNVS